MTATGTDRLSLLAHEVSALRRDQLPEDVAAAAVDCLIDTIAVMIAARDEPIRLVLENLSVGSGPCVRFSDGRHVDASAAALTNGALAHALDYDDWLAPAGLHPSAPLLPAILAQQDLRTTPASAAALLTAYVAGFEAQARIGVALAPHHYESGFHPTSSIGVFGAAAGVAKLLDLDPTGTQTAIGLATMAAGGLRASFGSMTKPLQVGRAADSGLLAARLASTGATAPADPVFGERGWTHTLATPVDSQPLGVPFQERWYVREVLVKRHASCFGTHASIDALLSLRSELAHTTLDSVEITVNPLLSTVCATQSPRTPLEGKFSLAFTAALAILRGSCDVADFGESTLSDHELLELTRRVSVQYSDRLLPQQAQVVVRLVDGSERAARTDSASLPDRLVRSNLVRRKFATLVVPALGAARADHLLSAIERVADADAPAELTRWI